MSIQFMADNDTINWNEITITIRHNIKLIHITINYYPEYISIYNSSKTNSKKKLEPFYNWKKVIDNWNKNILEYNKNFNIEFNKFILGVDYSLAPIYINNDNWFIGIFILNTFMIKNITKVKNTNIKSYNFLSRIEPYKYKKKLNSNKYNFFNGILINNNSQNLQNKEFIINTNLDTNLETKLTIPVKYILQNSMNYLPKLEINRIKMSFRNLLNP